MSATIENTNQTSMKKELPILKTPQEAYDYVYKNKNVGWFEYPVLAILAVYLFYSGVFDWNNQRSHFQFTLTFLSTFFFGLMLAISKYKGYLSVNSIPSIMKGVVFLIIGGGIYHWVQGERHQYYFEAGDAMGYLLAMIVGGFLFAFGIANLFYYFKDPKGMSIMDNYKNRTSEEAYFFTGVYFHFILEGKEATYVGRETLCDGCDGRKNRKQLETEDGLNRINEAQESNVSIIRENQAIEQFIEQERKSTILPTEPTVNATELQDKLLRLKNLKNQMDEGSKDK